MKEGVRALAELESEDVAGGGFGLRRCVLEEVRRASDRLLTVQAQIATVQEASLLPPQNASSKTYS